MNAVEIEQEVSKLAEQPFDAAEFPFAFLEAFGNKPATVKKLRSGTSNRSDLGGVLQTSNIHIAVAPRGEVTAMLRALKASPATAKAKFVLATDGETLGPRIFSHARRSPPPMPISPTSSGSSCRSPASARSARSARARSTCGPRSV